MAYISRLHGSRCLIVYNLDLKKAERAFCFGDSEVLWAKWKNDNRLILATSYRLSLQFRRGLASLDAFDVTAVDRDGKNELKLLSPATQIFGGYSGWRFLSSLDQDPDHILVSTGSAETCVVRIDVNTGKTERITPYERHVVWGSDARGTSIYYAKKNDVDQQADIYLRKKGEENFSLIQAPQILRSSLRLALADSPLQFIFISRQDSIYTQVLRYNLEKADDIGRIAADENHDIGIVEMHRGILTGLISGTKDSAQTLIDPSWQVDKRIFEKKFPGQDVVIIDKSENGRRTLAALRDGVRPYSYYTIVRDPGKPPCLYWLSDERPDIPDDQVASVTTISYTSRDGILIPAILTLPHQAAGKLLPFVILPHGGPQSEDFIQFDFLSQMIASRGYGVIQPNYRGSTGYGLAFQAAGYQQWGQKMQNDVSDARQYVVDHKLADPNKICIVGWSYGGYAALMGVVREPQAYRCAASIAGVTDLRNLASETDVGEALVGDNASIDANSPIANAAMINTPIFLAHAVGDERVSVAQSIAMEKALRSNSKKVIGVYYRGDTHSIEKEANRSDLLTRLAAFLKEHLGSGRTS